MREPRGFARRRMQNKCDSIRNHWSWDFGKANRPFLSECIRCVLSRLYFVRANNLWIFCSSPSLSTMPT